MSATSPAVRRGSSGPSGTSRLDAAPRRSRGREPVAEPVPGAPATAHGRLGHAEQRRGPRHSSGPRGSRARPGPSADRAGGRARRAARDGPQPPRRPRRPARSTASRRQRRGPPFVTPPSARRDARLDRDPVADPVQPAGERAADPERAGLAGQQQERRLEGVLGVVRVAEHLAADRQDHPPVPADQGLRTPPDRRRDLEPLEQLGVRLAPDRPVLVEAADIPRAASRAEPRSSSISSRLATRHLQYEGRTRGVDHEKCERMVRPVTGHRGRKPSPGVAGGARIADRQAGPGPGSRGSDACGDDVRSPSVYEDRHAQATG